MKINKPYTTSEGEKNRIRGLHESVKNKNFINEQLGGECMELMVTKCAGAIGPAIGTQFLSQCSLIDGAAPTQSHVGQQVRLSIAPAGHPNTSVFTIDTVSSAPATTTQVAEYSTQGATCPTTGPTYGCTQYGCQQVSHGQYNTYQDCQAACEQEDKWECQMPPGGGAVQCVSDPHGQYATLQDCQMMCDQQDMWSCDHQAGNCHQDPNGQFSTLHDCQMMCRGHMTWKCKNKGSHPKFGKKCVQVQSGGDFATKQKCVDSGCQGIGPDIPKDREVGMFRGGESPAQLGEGKLPKGWKMVTPAELDEEDMMDDLYEVWLGHENKIGMVQETPNLRKPRIFELPTRFGNKRLTEIELVNMINTIIK